MIEVRSARTVDRNTQSEFALIDPATPAGVQPVGRTGFAIVFSDEFEGSAVDFQKWQPYYPDTPFWNATVPGGHLTNTSEPQAYHPSGLSVSGSVLSMTMRNESTVAGLPFTSGMVTSYGSFNPTYGYAEARMRLADVERAWPAFWMDPTDQDWPPEIDIMENFATASFNTDIDCTYHPKVDPSDNTRVFNVGDLKVWRTYGCHWEPGRIRWYIDGALVKTYTDSDVSAKAMYLICNLAGNKSEDPNPADMPFSIGVDWIRFWQEA